MEPSQPGALCTQLSAWTLSVLRRSHPCPTVASRQPGGQLCRRRGGAGLWRGRYVREGSSQRSGSATGFKEGRAEVVLEGWREQQGLRLGSPRRRKDGLGGKGWKKGEDLELWAILQDRSAREGGGPWPYAGAVGSHGRFGREVGTVFFLKVNPGTAVCWVEWGEMAMGTS